MKQVATKRTSLRRWIWRAFVTTSLLPLVLVEGVLLASYFISNQSIRNSQIEHLHQSATRDIQVSVQQNALLVQGQLEQIRKAIKLYAKATENELSENLLPSAAQLEISAEGVRYSAVDDGASASFYSNVTPLEKQDLYKVSRLANQDFMMQQLKNEDPLIASIYFNSWDSYNRIYPWFNTLQQYPHDMDIPKFNFYYLADAKHNPEREVVWTDVYLDPAGNGWLMSAIAPVYSGEKLEGVAGVDVTVDGILKRIENLQVPWNGYLMLVSEKLNVMAVPLAGQRDFSLQKLESLAPGELVAQERLQSSDFNIASHPGLSALSERLPKLDKGLVTMTLNGRPHLVAWSNIPSTGWHLLAVVDEAAVMEETNMLANHYRQIGYWMIAGLVLFYAMFFAFMWWRARALSHQLHSPVLGVSRMMREIGQGNGHPVGTPSDIEELWSMSNQALGMGRQLAEAESRRRSTQQRLELVMESFAEGLWEYSPNTGRFILKGALCLRFGFSSNDVPMELLLEKIHIEDRETFTQFLVAAQGSDSVAVEVEFRIKGVQGELIWILCRGRTLAPSHPEGFRGVVVACVDITTLKRTQLDLRGKTLEAESASSAKSKFISSMSHELRTPLNAIYGFAQLGLMQAPVDSLQHTANLDEIIGASEHLMQLVDDLLDLSSLQADKTLLGLKPIPVQALLQSCADMVHQQALGHNQTLHIEEVPDHWEVWADKRRLKQVLINLLSNAIKYNRPHGSITLGARANDDGSCLQLYVIDTGIGISAVLQNELFTPFQRLGKENSSIQGTGIGLALCRDLAHLMHGSMGFKSELGEGSTFWIELCSAEHSMPVDAATSSQPSTLPKVLLVSDNLEQGELINDALAGYAEVELVGTLLQAELSLQGSSVKVLITATQDSVAVLNAFIKRLRKNAAPGVMSIIVVDSGRDEEVTRQLDCQALLAIPMEPLSVRRVVLAITMGVPNLCFPK
ncbi:Sensor histidine kinase RcsC [Pseudomonas fluorescens]|uniref:histidine kinase n=1 Tax=Pseudomonas fluorescens TaxID=294 RepID=A0A5E6PHZ6_PSEFL|nr:ATP-binding protein [Pseudomonas fluorescens]VVM43061.1 Sensor histidine kinase RcsC [Pseudomonas fluorescens]